MDRLHCIFLPIVLLFAALAAPGVTAQELAPDELVRTVTQDVISVIKQDKEIQAGDEEKTIALVEEKVLPHFDFTRMTALAMGVNWRRAIPEQRRALVDEFRTLLVRTYSTALSAYRNQVIEVMPVRAKRGDTQVAVRSVVKQSGAEPVTIDYSMEKTPDGWKVYDVAVGGMSLVTTYRDTFANEVRNVGIDGLIRALAEKNRQLKTKRAARARLRQPRESGTHATAVVRREDDRLLLEGAVTLETVPKLLGEGAAQVRNGVAIIDFAGVTKVDSAALGLALGWVREARAAGRTIRFANLPPSMQTLAQLYGVDEFLPRAQT